MRNIHSTKTVGMRDIYLIKTDSYEANQTISAVIVADSLDAIKYAMLESVSINQNQYTNAVDIASVFKEEFEDTVLAHYKEHFKVARQKGCWNCLNIPTFDAYKGYTIEYLGMAARGYDYCTLINEEICPFDSEF